MGYGREARGKRRLEQKTENGDRRPETGDRRKVDDIFVCLSGILHPASCIVSIKAVDYQFVFHEK